MVTSLRTDEKRGQSTQLSPIRLKQHPYRFDSSAKMKESSRQL
jgi:hypothetical protein